MISAFQSFKDSMLVSISSLRLTHVREKHVVFEVPGVPLEWQHLLSWCPGIGKVEELPLVLVTLVCL